MSSKKFKAPLVNQGARIKVDPTQGGGSTQAELVRFSFRFFHLDCIANCTSDEIAAALRKMRGLSTLTWQQVKQAPREGFGHELITREQLLVPCARDLAPSVESVLSFRSSDAERIIGHRDGAILHVLWFTHDHDAYAAG